MPRLFENPVNKITEILIVHHLLEGVDIGVSDALNTTEEKRGHIYKRGCCSHSVWTQCEI